MPRNILIYLYDPKQVVRQSIHEFGNQSSGLMEGSKTDVIESVRALLIEH
jgi:hypothetical protein